MTSYIAYIERITDAYKESCSNDGELTEKYNGYQECKLLLEEFMSASVWSSH